VQRIEIPDMVMGRARYSLDVTLPGMLFAAVTRCPVIGGRVARFDASRAVKGVHRVLEIASGIAVVAESFWSALQGRNALDVTWDEGANTGLSTAVIRERFRRAAKRRGKVKREEGNVERALSEAARLVEAVYETPYLAHAPLEPMNCTADVRKDGCDIWVGTQGQQGVRRTAARITGLPEDAIRVHTTFLGGGFGRRLEQDFVAEAVEISKAVGAPVQVVWTREDDMRHGSFRPASYTVLRAGLDDSGMPVAWYQKTVGPDLALNGIDIPYAIPHIRDERVEEDPSVPTGAWRSVGASQNAFAVEGFIDELAHAAGRDPLEFRLALLAHSPRHRSVLTLASEKAGWGKRLPEGHHQGIAVYHSFASWCAQIAELSIAEDGTVKVHRVVCAIDCGTVVNPDTVASQMEGSIVFGLSAALKGEITIEGGQVQQKSYEDYPIVTLAEMPEVEVYILPSQEPPGGVGEPGVPPVAPAVANAVFAATGRRLRRLPLRVS
jgi:isoquinoline 1-oxidoreductase beta subunit